MMEKEVKKNKVFISYEKAKGKSPVDDSFDINEWGPRNNGVILHATMKEGKKIIVVNTTDAANTMEFYLFKASENLPELKEKEGKAVILRDYTLGVSLLPLKSDDEGKDVYYFTYEHNIILVEI